jgi:hypothetical protein
MRTAGRVWLLASVLLFSVGCASASSVGRKAGEDPLAPREYALPQRVVFDKAVEAMVEMGWRVTLAQPDPGLIQGHTPVSLASWREDLTVSVLDLKNGQVRVQMTSRARQLVDWGKSSDNIQAFFDQLDARLKDVTVPAAEEPMSAPVPLEAAEST